MPQDSQSSTPPGQQPAELPTSLKYDEPAMIIWSLFMLLFPPMWMDGDKPFHKRFWAWRYVYLGFFLVTALYYAEALLRGDYLVLALFPFAHVLAAFSITGLVMGFQVPGAAVPFVSYPVAATTYAALVVTIGAVEVGRRTSPQLLTRTPWECDDDELVVPYEDIETKHDDAPTPPTLKQDVSTAVIGETGSGKSSAMQLLAYQLPYNADTAVIAHDAGEEFQQFYSDLEFDVKRVGLDGDVTWNLFKDAESMQDFREIAAAVFGNPDGHNPFHTPAKQVFEDMLMYLHLEAQRNNRRDNLSHMDIVSLLEEGRAGIYKKLDRYDRLESDHLDTDQGKGAQNVYQTLIEYTRPVFVDDFGDHGSFSLREYIQNPDGRVLIIDSSPSRMATLGPMFQLLIDWSIRFAMESPNPTVHVLDEIDQLPPLGQITNLTARGRKEKARALVGVQTIGQLEDTYSDISGILGNCPQGLYFGPGDAQSTEFIRNEIGERRILDRTETYALSRNTGAKTQRSQARESVRETEKAPVTSGQLRDFEPGECITVTRTAWWHGQTYELHQVRDDLPDRGVDSSGTPREEDPDGGLTETDSWIELVKQYVARRETADDGVNDDQSVDETSLDVWADPDVDETPAITYSDRHWQDALSRLDVDSAPITQGQNVDAFSDLCAMLDRRVLDLPESEEVTAEVRELLIEVYRATGLLPSEVLDEVEKRTSLLRMSDTFRETYITMALDSDATAVTPADESTEELPHTLFEEQLDSPLPSDSDSSMSADQCGESGSQSDAETAISDTGSPVSPDDTDTRDTATPDSMSASDCEDQKGPTDDNDRSSKTASDPASDTNSESADDDVDAADFM